MDELQTFQQPHSVPTNISESVQFLVNQLKQVESRSRHSREYVHADAANQRAYFIYEKLRNAVEYKEQHLFLRSAIERYLNRNLRLLRRNEELGRELVVELVKTRYLPNDSVPIEILDPVNQMLEDYKYLLDQINAQETGRRKEKLLDSILQIASSDIERLLVSREADELFVNFTYGVMLERLDPNFLADNNSIDLKRSLFISIHRLLLKSDVARIRYYLFYAEFPNWRSHGASSINQTAAQIGQFIDILDSSLRSKLTRKVGKLLRPHIAPFRVLHHLILEEKEPTELLQDTEKLKRRIELVCQSEYERIRTRVRTSIVRSIIFIFITKLSLAIILEIPYDRFVAGEIHWIPLAINLAFPPLYMLLISLDIRIPGEANTRKIVDDILAIVKNQNPDQHYAIGARQAPTSLRSLFSTLYVVGFVVIVMLLVQMLVKLNFNIISGVLFFVFLSTVSFFGVRISALAKELVVLDEKPGIIGLIIDIASSPFIRIGQWLSDTYSKINVLNFALDVIIELPFKTILRIFDDWSQYLKEKKDDLL